MADANLIAQGTREQIAANAFDFLELWRETDSGRIGAGSAAGGGRCYLAITEDGPNIGPITTDQSIDVPVPAWCNTYRVRVIIEEGSGPFVVGLYLPERRLRVDADLFIENMEGDMVEMRIEMPASANPTIEVKNAGDGIIKTLPPDALLARTYIVQARYKELAWQIWDCRQSNS